MLTRMAFFLSSGRKGLINLVSDYWYATGEAKRKGKEKEKKSKTQVKNELVRSLVNG